MSEPPNKTLMIVVASDPRSSHRPAEAIRLAAGIAAWRKVDVTLFFTGPGVAAVSSDPDDFVDPESYTSHLPMLLEHGRPLLVDSESQPPANRVDCTAILRPQFYAVAADATYVLRF
jgi:hypothetical protein